MYDGVKAMIDAEKALRPKEVPVEELAEVKEIEKKLDAVSLRNRSGL